MTEDYILVTELTKLNTLLKDLSENQCFEFVALDSESYPSVRISNEQNVKLGLSPKLNDLRLLQIGLCDSCEEDSGSVFWFPKMENFRNYVIDLMQFSEKQLTKLWRLLDKKTLIMHNAKFDLAMLNYHYKFFPKKIFCTLVTSQTMGHATGSTHVGSMGRSLADLVSDWLSMPGRPIKMDKTQRLSDWSKEHLTKAQLDYAAKDTQYLIPLCMLIKRFARQVDMEFDINLENQVLPAVIRMEQNGLMLDKELYNRIAYLAREEIPKLQCDVFRLLGIPLQKSSRLGGKKTSFVVTDSKVFNSPVRLKKVLKSAGINVENLQAATLKALVDTLKGEVSSDEETLDENILDELLSDKAGSMPREDKLKLVENLMRIKVLQKLIDNQYDRFVNPKTSRIHPRFNQARAQTGRFACTNPNLQSVSKGGIYDPEANTEYYLREIFKPKGKWVEEDGVKFWEGYIMGARDIDRQELAVAAYASGDKVLKRALDEGEDLHTTHALLAWPELTAAEVRIPMEKLGGKKPRDQAKVII